MEKILTISVAAYNVEKFLGQTLVSCVNIEKEILDKIEVFIVDDGSKDNTERIGEDYQKKYSDSIYYIKKENGGHGSTVNYSMQHAKGKYFMLLDGDDWVDSEQFEKLVVLLEKEESDIVSCSYNMVDNDTLKVKGVDNNKEFTCYQKYKAEEVLNTARIYLAGLVIKTEILKEHPFRLTEKCFFVDMEYVTFPIPYVETVTFYDLVVYQCRTALAGQSTSRMGSVKHADDHVKVAKSLAKFYCKEKERNIEAYKLKYIFNMCAKVIEDVYLLPFSFPVSDKTIRKKILEFDSYLKRTDQELYDIRFRKKVCVMRKTSYIGWRIIAILDRFNSR